MRSKHVLLSAGAAAYVVPRRRTPLLPRDSRQRFAFAAYDRGSRRQRSLVHDKEAPYVELASVRASYGRCLYPRAITYPADRGKMYRFFSMKKSSGPLLVLSGIIRHPRNPGTIHPRLRIARSSNPLLTFSGIIRHPRNPGTIHPRLRIARSSNPLLTFSGIIRHPRNPGTIHPRLRIARSSNPLLTLSGIIRHPRNPGTMHPRLRIAKRFQPLRLRCRMFAVDASAAHHSEAIRHSVSRRGCV